MTVSIEQAMSFTELFKEARRRRGLTHRQLAELAGVNHSFIGSQLEHPAGPGEKISLILTLRVARVLGIPASDIARALGLDETGTDARGPRVEVVRFHEGSGLYAR